jgi:hypothetical protein
LLGVVVGTGCSSRVFGTSNWLLFLADPAHFDLGTGLFVFPGSRLGCNIIIVCHQLSGLFDKSTMSASFLDLELRLYLYSWWLVFLLFFLTLHFLWLLLRGRLLLGCFPHNVLLLLLLLLLLLFQLLLLLLSLLLLLPFSLFTLLPFFLFLLHSLLLLLLTLALSLLLLFLLSLLCFLLLSECFLLSSSLGLVVVGLSIVLVLLALIAGNS